MQQTKTMPQGGGGTALSMAADACGSLSHRKLAPVLGLAVAVGLMVLSLSAFVVGSHSGSNRGILAGYSAVDFSARDLSGQRHALHEFRGAPVLLVFGTVGELAAHDPSLPEGLQVLLLTAEPEPRILAPELAHADLVLHDEGGLIAEKYAVWTGTAREEGAAPQTVLISADGVILERGRLAGVLEPFQAQEIR